MRKPVLISLIVVLAVLAYLVFTLIFARILEYTAARRVPATPTPAPTFTITATATPLMAAMLVTATPPPADIVPPTASPTAAASSTPSPTPPPQISAARAVNVRSGPGTVYPVIGQLAPNQPLPVVGQNQGGSWWQVTLANGSPGWVAASVVVANGSWTMPVVAAPPPPPTATPTPTPAPTATPLPKFQYEPTGWFADTNYGLTRFLGSITDAGGNPVNGISIEAQCGSFRVISNPSGPVGWPPFYNSASDPPGFYDITLATHPIPCIWFLTVVESPDGKSVTARLSDAIRVETTVDASIVTANWRKNW